MKDSDNTSDPGSPTTGDEQNSATEDNAKYQEPKPHRRRRRSASHDDIPAYVSINDTQSSYEPVLQDVDSIEMNSSLCELVLKLPSEQEDWDVEEISNNLPYKDFTNLCTFIGIRVQKTRTKKDLIAAIKAYAGDVWTELFDKAYDFKQEQAKKQQEIGPLMKISSSTSSTSIESRNTERKPYDARMAMILSDMFKKQNVNESLYLYTTTKKEAKKIKDTFSALSAPSLEPYHGPNTVDSLFTSYLTGPAQSASESISKLVEACINLDKLTSSFTGEQTPAGSSALIY